MSPEPTPVSVTAAVYLNQVQFMTPGSKKGGGGPSTVRQHSSTSSSTSAANSTIMSFVSTSSGSGGSQTTISTVGPAATTATPGGAAPASTNKRGRKPGPLSKSAREAQRRLNHSIIEKARRTKINDALATLKRLVPIDYLQTREMQKLLAADGNDNCGINEEEGEDDDLDDDDEGGDDEAPGDDAEYRELASRTSASASSTTDTKQRSSTSKTPAPKAGKKQEKEKEFKLEILVRTVVFLQDLLERVGHLEAAVSSSTSSSIPGNELEHCVACGNTMRLSPSSTSSTSTTTSNSKKRKREFTSFSSPTIEKDLNDALGHGNTQSRTKVARTASSSSEFTIPDLEEVPPTPRFSPQQQRTAAGAQSPMNTTSSSLPSSSSSSAERRLPSISSWLHNDAHLPSPLSFGTFVGSVPGKEMGGNNKFGYSPVPNVPPGSYLPSPPSSTHCFGPIRTYASTQVPPVLNLGPGATSSSSSSRRIVTRSPPTSKSLGKSPASTSGASAAQRASATPTPEDESAASMLLQIASSASPPFRPINPPAFSSSSSSASSSSKCTSSATSPNFPGYHNANALPEPTQFSLYSSPHLHPHAHSHPHPRPHPHPHSRPHPYQPQPDNQRPQLQYDDRPTASVRQVETPSSILGIRKY